MDSQKIWLAVLGELEVTLSTANFTTWFKNTALAGVSGETATISVPNAFTRDWLQRKYQDDILSSLQKHLPDVKKIEFSVGSVPQAEPAPEPAAVEDYGQDLPEVGGSQAAPSNTFENFVVGNSNRLAYAAAQAVTQNPGKTYNPLFLYGGAGLGKTHLMQGIVKEIQQKHGLKTLYITAEGFMNELVAAISQNKTAAFKNRFRKADVLLVDDIQFLAGKDTMQEEFFHTFNALHGDGRQIVLTSDRPPKAIPTLEERLRSRFEWGMIADVAPPELETRTAIVQTKAKERGYNIPPEVSDYIVRSIQQNIRELEGALIRVMAHAELTGEVPTVQLAERVLGNLLAARAHRQLSSNQIVDVVARFYDIPVEQIRGPGRQKEIVKPRQLAMYLLREEANLSYPKIGQEIGGRDHTTVIHAVEKIAGLSEVDEPLRHELNLIKERLYA